MMTPVYEEVIADWRANICSVNPYAARLDLSVFSTNKESKNNDCRPVKKHLFLCSSNKLNKHTFQRFHSATNKTAENLPRAKKQYITRNIFLLSCSLSKQNIFPTYPNPDRRKGTKYNIYGSEVTNLTDYNVVKSGTDVLWQQAKFELIIKRARVMHFVATSKSNGRTSPQPPLTRRSNAA